MTTTEALLAIPIMFYVCLAVLPILIIFYWVISKPKRTLPSAKISPIQALKQTPSKVNVTSEIVKNLLLGSIIGVGVSIIIFIAMLGKQWYDSTGIFAVELPFNTIPPLASDILPPPPPTYSETEANSSNNNQNIKNNNANMAK